MTRDETRYPNAERFIPERFLDAKGMLTDDKVDFVFGFGRRVCPGKQLRITRLSPNRAHSTHFRQVDTLLIRLFGVLW